ncbi:MAG: hypothetical protein DRQ48_10795 [Gammaproteobacteria bacterium]|nr:MAG: hypothetical protein DRQ48_10795 [Gammaproteobacteria bacterium]
MNKTCKCGFTGPSDKFLKNRSLCHPCWNKAAKQYRVNKIARDKAAGIIKKPKPKPPQKPYMTWAQKEVAARVPKILPGRNRVRTCVWCACNSFNNPQQLEDHITRCETRVEFMSHLV